MGHPLPIPSLNVSCVEATAALKPQVHAGIEILGQRITDEDQLEGARSKRKHWMGVVDLLLRKILTTDELVKEFRTSSRGHYRLDPSYTDKVRYFRDDMSASITVLQSILDRLPLLAEPRADAVAAPSTDERDPTRVFLVHGHDEAARESVARFIERLGLKPIILHEQASRGQTVIEKFENNSAVGFAVVLLTPDDIGGKDESSLRPRARQNVILELGFFCGTLGRNRVCALHRGDVELPSDFDGVIYVPLDQHNAWHLVLAREMKAAGLTVDLNRAV